MSARPRKRGRRGGGGGYQEPVPSIKREDLEPLKVAELREKAAELGLDTKDLKKKDELIDAVLEAKVRAEGFIEVRGILDILPEGYGFLRTTGYLPGDTDVYVSMSTIRRYELRRGDMIKGQVRPPKDNEKYPALQRTQAVNQRDPETLRGRPKFNDLTPVYPDVRFRLEHGPQFITARVIDLVAPIGKGQRGLIVSPPKAGKTTVLKDIAAAITANTPEAYLMCLLVDERPEEVTDMERSIQGEVVSSTFDMPSENHIAVAELVMERAKRLVEAGWDVVILLDSITRLARAYNLATPASGRILSGGVDSTALYPPKKFFGAARNIENGGSLTILATALVDTGSKMDEVIFEEFKGTGNMELRLDRGMADRRIFPAIDVVVSGTRKEELLLDPQEAPFVWGLRRVLHGVDSPERALDMLIKGLKQTTTNQEFLVRMAKGAQDKRNGIEV
jgi:transcription termination factor Rho